MAGLLDNEWDPYGVNIVDGTMVERMEDPTFGHPQTPPTMLYPDGIWEQTNRGQEFDEEIKVEQQAGEPDKTTTILKPKPSPAEPDLQAMGQSFNPMDLWSKVSSIVDAEMMTQEESNKKAQQIQIMAQGSSNAPGQSFGTPPVQPGVSADPTVPQGPQGPHMGDQSFTSPYQMPQGIQGNGPHPTNQPPPPVPAGQGFHPLEGPNPYVPQGTPPGQPPVDPTAGMGIPYSDTPDQAPPGMSEGMGMEQPPIEPTALDPYNPTAAAEELGQVNQDWLSLQTQSGAAPADIEKSEVTIKTAAEQATGNTVNGEDASDDPVMNREWAGQMDPRARQAEYLMNMNMIILGGIMLDIAANAMGIKSESGSYMTGQMKLLEQRMKFDDQNRIYDATMRAYYPNGTYKSPGSQADVFDALMQTGMVSPAEASAISGNHPETKDPVGWDEYYVIDPDTGGIKSVFVPKNHPPPPGATGNATVAAANSPTSGSDTSAMKTEAEVNLMRENADILEAGGDLVGAEKLRRRASDLLALGGGRSTKEEFNYTAARNTFDGMYKPMVTASAGGVNRENTFRDVDGEFIPWSEFRQKWLNSYEVDVMGSDNKMRKEVGWLQIKADPTQSAASIAVNSRIPSAAALAELDSNPTPEAIKEFIEFFGFNQLPEKYK